MVAYSLKDIKTLRIFLKADIKVIVSDIVAIRLRLFIHRKNDKGGSFDMQVKIKGCLKSHRKKIAGKIVRREVLFAINILLSALPSGLPLLKLWQKQAGRLPSYYFPGKN